MGLTNTSDYDFNNNLSVCDLLLEPSISGPSSALLFKNVATPLILLLGILGNSLSIVVMSSRMLRHKSYSQFLCTLALFDTLTLIGREVHVVEELMDAMGRPSPFQGFTGGTCKLYRFAENVSVTMSSWIIVLMALERFVVIFFPFRRYTMCTPGRSVLGIIFAFVVICLSQTFTILMMGYDELSGSCSAKPEYNLIYTEVYIYFFLLCLILIFPMITRIICNVAVAAKVFRYRQVREKFRSSDTSVGSISRQRLKTTAMLLTISSVYVVTLMPSVISMFFIQVTIFDAMYERILDERMCQALFNFQPYSHILEVISALNYAVNFYIYVLSGKSFRVQLKKILSRESTTSSTRIRHELSRSNVKT